MSKARDFGDLAKAFHDDPEQFMRDLDEMLLDELNDFAITALKFSGILGRVHAKRMTEYMRERPRPIVDRVDLDRYWPDESLGANDPELQ